MFSRKDQLLKKTGPDGIGRYDYLRLLKKEFEETKNEDAKSQVLANLANFAYDPINYDYIRSLKLIELFLEYLNSTNDIYANFSIAAICNLSSDAKNREIIIRNDGITLISKVLYNGTGECILNAITSLIFLNVEETEHLVKSSIIVDKIKQFEQNGDARLKNLAVIFLQDLLK